MVRPNFHHASADILSLWHLWQLGFEHVTNARYFCPVVYFVTVYAISGSVHLAIPFVMMCNVQCQLLSAWWVIFSLCAMSNVS